MQKLKKALAQYSYLCFFFSCLADKLENGDVYQRRRGTHSGVSNGQEAGSKQVEEIGRTGSSWRRILLLILAITIHNIPGLSGLSGLTHKTHTIITVVRRFAPEVYHTLLADKKCLGDRNLDKTQPLTYDLLTHFTCENLQPLHTTCFTGLCSCSH